MSKKPNQSNQPTSANNSLSEAFDAVEELRAIQRDSIQATRALGDSTSFLCDSLSLCDGLGEKNGLKTVDEYVEESARAFTELAKVATKLSSCCNQWRMGARLTAQLQGKA